MDCSICSSRISSFGVSKDAICTRCYDGSRKIIELLKKVADSGCGEESDNSEYELKSDKPMGISDVFQRVKELKEQKEEMREMLGFLGGLGAAFREGIHTDILVQPSTGSLIPAHRAVLATKSDVFKNLLSSDECKAPPQDTISLPEMSHDELSCLLEFLYCGTLNPVDKVEKHLCPLLQAADKYDIPFLKKFCQTQILRVLGPANALHVLEVADICSNVMLKEEAMSSVVEYRDELLWSAAYDALALRSPKLSVEITRAMLRQMNLVQKSAPEAQSCAQLCVATSRTSQILVAQPFPGFGAFGRR